VLSTAISAQSFETIARRDTQVVELLRRIRLIYNVIGAPVRIKLRTPMLLKLRYKWKQACHHLFGGPLFGQVPRGGVARLCCRLSMIRRSELFSGSARSSGEPLREMIGFTPERLMELKARG
jgi:hypothetical protein